ncbi:coronin-7 isoform X2 [Hydra vulgaris]|uniref:Coronin n=1 Tax=Hydra vulgaris TaxID=6087 RepID=A0ABM4D3W8_HYDVU
MQRFKVSKYKNAAPKIPKKEECISEIPCSKVMLSCGDFVKCSGTHIAFNVDSGAGGCVSVLPLETTGRRNKSVPLVYAHEEFVNDMCFSPFKDNLLTTCSHDGKVKLWNVSDSFNETLDSALCIVHPDKDTKKIDIVKFNPAADEVLACAAANSLHIIDLTTGDVKCTTTGIGIYPQSIDWKLDGSLMVTSSKDTSYNIIDSRAQSTINSFAGFGGNKDSRLLWIGNTDYIFGTGFAKSNGRMLGLWDVRNTSSMVFQHYVDQGSGTLMPLLDIDTNMIMVAGKGDSFISLYEFNTETNQVSLSSVQNLDNQTYGIGMVPKRVLNVMQGEVNRLYQLSKNLLTPLPYIIPRKSYREFHADLFPDTVYSGLPAMNASDWFKGKTAVSPKISLDPKNVIQKSNNTGLKHVAVNDKSEKEQLKHNEASEKHIEKISDYSSSVLSTKNSAIENSALTSNNCGEKEATFNVESVNKQAIFNTGHYSKFKHLVGEKLHKSKNIENIKNLAESLPSESDGFKVFNDFAAVPLGGSGGQLGVFQLSKPGRLPESDIPVLQNSSNILDFDIDPFDNRNIAVGCDDWKIRIWKVPDNGLTATLEEPNHILIGHNQRVTIVKYHPTASNILASVSLDLSVKIWDLNSYSEIGALEGHKDQILCLSWHPDGQYLATLSKDKKIRIYDPVNSLEPIKEGDAPDTLRGARMCWCGPKNNWIVVSIVNSSGRHLMLFESDEVKQISSLQQIDTSPSILSLHYDEDSSTLFATGKGDRIVYTFEIHENYPHMFALSFFRSTTLHQGISFLQKNLLDVSKVEFAKAACLTKNNIEIISFTLPRTKTEFFQDDVFPETRVTWEQSLSGDDWLDGNLLPQKRISLQPFGMLKLSEAPKELPKASKYCSQSILAEKSDEDKKTELINAMMGKLEVDHKLEQDKFEGVDEEEWDD